MKWLSLLLLVTLVIAQENGIKLPAEWEKHTVTYLCWPRTDEIWYYKGIDLLTEVRKDVARIANAIAGCEPVIVLCDPSQVNDARRYLDEGVTIQAIELDDLWARDTLPVFTIENGKLKANIFNFNGWGKKQKPRDRDAQLAANVAKLYGIESSIARITAEGGSFETDGKGTLLVTESSLVNTNRNSQSKEEIVAELKRTLGVEKVIWFKGVKGKDITDAHVDCLVRFVRPGVVIINRANPRDEPDVWSISSDEALDVLKRSTDAKGNRFEIIEIFEADTSKIAVKGNATTYLGSYANFLIANGCVIIPEFGDTNADSKAYSAIRGAFSDRRIVPVPINALASGGGGIHCATHEQPALE